MSTKNRPQPVHEMRLGPMKLSVWKNESTKGQPLYKSTFVHVYRVSADQRGDEDNGWRESTSFGPEDLVLLRELARLGSKWIRQQKLASLPVEPKAS